ncbi:hypothetical protein MW887_000335 [Aspergillus wentii]|nr:hypothetical protein MW887_000335 [Aspergillus wentii]
MTIPQTQIAAVLPPSGASPDARVQISTNHLVPVPGEGELLIKLEFSGVCHSDVHSIRGETPMLTDVAGHEGVGKVVSVGGNVHEQEWVGRRVGISGEKKKQLCLALGATSFFDYKIDNVEQGVKSLTSGLGAHAVICTANGEPAYTQSMHLLRRMGVLVCVGIPSVPFRLPATPFDMIVKGLTIVGNSAGTAKEMDELLKMAVEGDIRAHVECFELDCINDVLDRLERAEIDGRAVVRIPE